MLNISNIKSKNPFKSQNVTQPISINNEIERYLTNIFEMEMSQAG